MFGPLGKNLSSILTENSHAYQMVNCHEKGEDGWQKVIYGPSLGHGKCFGTMIIAVKARVWDLLKLKGDSNTYKRHHYDRGEGLP